MTILDASSSTFRRDLRTSYFVSFSKVGSWVIVSMLLAWQSPEAFAVFALARATLTFLNYASSGLVPILIIDISDRIRSGSFHKGAPDHDTQRSVDSATALAILGCMAMGAVAIAIAFASPWLFGQTAVSPMATFAVFTMLGIGLVAKLFSDVAGAVIQASGGISRDNWVLIGADIVWIAAAVVGHSTHATLLGASIGFFLSGLFILLVRLRLSKSVMGYHLRPRSSDPNVISGLLRRGGLLTLANVADYFYGPSVMILAGLLLTTTETAVYAAMLQIDSAMLLLVGAVASVIFPYAARVRPDESGAATLLKYYALGSLASLLVLCVAGAILLLARNELFWLWFKDSAGHRELASTLLPWLLIHTIVGGAGLAGRSVLLGMGRTKLVSIIMLLAGLTNVVLACVLMGLLGWGLKGAIVATIIVVSTRVLLVQPLLIVSAIAARRAPGAGN